MQTLHALVALLPELVSSAWRGLAHLVYGSSLWLLHAWQMAPSSDKEGAIGSAACALRVITDL